MPDTNVAIGLDVGGTNSKGALVERDGNILARVQHPTDPTAGTKGIIEVIEELTRRAAELELRPTCVGVGVAGFVDAATGSVTFAPNLSYDDPHIADAVRTRTNLPVVVDNDANSASWGERAFGGAKGCDDVALVTLGTGIGSGFVVGGKLLRGFSGAGAEFGHTIVDPQGPQCKCGLRGCIEQFASGSAIARMGREAALVNPDTSMLNFAGSAEAIGTLDVARAAREYDPVAREVMTTAGRWLGIALSNIANLFDPEVIVLGGGVIRAGEPYLGAARDRLHEMTAAQRRRPMRLDVTKLGEDAGILGAAALAFDEAK